jgi:hypothetical protein
MEGQHICIFYRPDMTLNITDNAPIVLIATHDTGKRSDRADTLGLPHNTCVFIVERPQLISREVGRCLRGTERQHEGRNGNKSSESMFHHLSPSRNKNTLLALLQHDH